MLSMNQIVRLEQLLYRQELSFILNPPASRWIPAVLDQSSWHARRSPEETPPPCNLTIRSYCSGPSVQENTVYCSLSHAVQAARSICLRVHYAHFATNADAFHRCVRSLHEVYSACVAGRGLSDYITYIFPALQKTKKRGFCHARIAPQKVNFSKIVRGSMPRNPHWRRSCLGTRSPLIQYDFAETLY